MNIHRCCILMVSRKFVDVMLVCSCIPSSNIFISSISDKPQMQTDYKNNKIPVNDNKRILILMV